MNWFLYDKDLRHERVSGLILTLKISIINNQKPSPGGGELCEIDYLKNTQN